MSGSTTSQRQPYKTLMPIGMFSRASLLSIKALRSYHEQGILIPAVVDPQTGYRSYHPGQLSDASVLSRLRGLDLPLRQVKEILVRRDPAITGKILADHQKRMVDRLEETERIVQDLQRAIELPAEQTPVHVRALEHHYALAVTGTVRSSDFASFLGSAYGLLYSAVSELGFAASGEGVALYRPVIHDDEAEPVTAYIPVREPMDIPQPDRGLQVLEIPTQTMAVIVHRGPYETVGETYAQLGAWVAHNDHDNTSLEADGRAEDSNRDVAISEAIREIYLVSVPHSNDPSTYRTEICWPLSDCAD